MLTGSARSSWADDPPAAAAPGDAAAGDAPDNKALADQVRALQQEVDQLKKAATPPEGTPQEQPRKGQTDTEHTNGKLAEPAAKPSGPPPLTWMGVTVYGVVDLSIAHLTHGAPLSNTYPASLPFVLQSFSNHPITSIADNGLSQSRLGLSGIEPLHILDIKAVFRLETAFQPTSGRLSDGPRSLVDNNGVPLAKRITSGDSARAGQPLQSAAYVGLSSTTYGTATFGRQNTLMSDALLKYDPQLQSQTFSPISYSGTSAGFGDTEDKTLDISAKYVLTYGPFHVAGMYQFGRHGYEPEGYYGGAIGFEYAGLSIDAVAGKVKGAIAAASLNATQAAAAPGTLAGTISDNTGFAVLGLYTLKPFRFYASYEHIVYDNPENPLPAGTVTIGSYVLSVVNNAAYNIKRKLDYFWAGARYAVLPQLELSLGYYLFFQNSYNANGCTDDSAGSCSGTFHDVSFVADYRLSPRFDTYAGFNYTTGSDGLVAGFLNTSDLATVAGIRFTF
ncbi:MAG TPA: porin [Kofleriaceae bacterium]|nr:porin [Kofleriaceae bacterium]